MLIRMKVSTVFLLHHKITLKNFNVSTSTFLFFNLKNCFNRIGKPAQLVRHTITADDDVTFKIYMKKIGHIL